jgi:hypothetical protein
LPPATAKVGNKTGLIEKIPPENLGYAEDEMAMEDGLDDFFTEPFAKSQQRIMDGRDTFWQL